MHWLVLAILILVPASTRAELIAEQITPERYEALRVGGPDAIAGVGDWALGNGVLCAAVSDPSHESGLSHRGGLLIDLGHCGRDDDQWNVIQPLLNLSQSEVMPFSEVRAERSETRAALVASGASRGLDIEITYALDAKEPRALELVTRITRREEGERLFAYGNVVLHPNGSLRPFKVDRRDPRRSVGFAHPGGDPAETTSMLSAIVQADLIVWVGSDRMGPGISYGLDLVRSLRVDPEGNQRPLPELSISGGHYTLTGAFPRPFWIGDDADPGLLELVQTPLMDLATGDTLVLERRLWVGDRADVASVTDRLWPAEPVLRGKVDEPGAVVHVSTKAGEPVSAVRADAGGDFALRLPAGPYGLRARGEAGREARAEVTHHNPGVAVQLALAPGTRVRLPRGEPMRLVFLGAEGSQTPGFGSDGLDLAIDDEPVPTSLSSNDVALAGIAGDPAFVTLRPGAYRVLAVRGPEHEVTEARLAVRAGEETTLEIPAPGRVRETPGWVSADLHVHSGWSFDSSLPQERQLRAFAAADAEILVATEHDRIVDPRPALASLGLTDRILGVTGVEITTGYRGGVTPTTAGHANAFPVREQRATFRGGAPMAEGRRWRDVWAELRAAGAPILQLNHPRVGRDQGDDDGAFLDHLGVGAGYDPSRPLGEAVNRPLSERGEHGLRDLDFDAMELLNGRGHGAYERVRTDWFSFLLQGERRTATANSDSHSLGAPAAFPRSYVRLPGGVAEEAAFGEAIRSGELWGTTGPLLDVRLGEAGLGGLHAGAEAELRVGIDAAPWVPLGEVRVLVNGVLAERQSLDGPEDLRFPLHFPADAFVTVEVEGEPGGVYAEVLPGFVPFAFTNPIYVDADEDGRWTPPGLP